MILNVEMSLEIEGAGEIKEVVEVETKSNYMCKKNNELIGRAWVEWAQTKIKTQFRVLGIKE